MQTIKERLATLDDGHCLYIVAPIIEHKITGTSCVRVMKDGTVKVVYKNGMIEERKGTNALLGAMDADQPSLFELIEYVRNGRGTLPCHTQAERKA